ncbi:acetyl esterase [Haladaptatus litoreus]|uniref:Acetyl esterase n=1 Tax=Haladaptatus litoreus TaxID=553468 RepID=A0A1N7DKT0_9EURY|nr:alpha/beta hydrolase [Haladaptatus litoreus]SIR76463.1 acetyl esterase [Haladaptatus litoreus]
MEADEIHPQAKRVLKRQQYFPLPHSERGLRFFRLYTRGIARIWNRNPPSVGKIVDRTIPDSDEPLEAKLYLPEGSGPFPTVVFFHGGGFVFGDLTTYDVLCRQLTRASGCAVLSVAYRLAPEHPFPAAVEDAYTAVKWAASNPSAIGSTGDLAVAGDSAGGNLAAVTSLMAAEQNGPEITHQALLYPAIGSEAGQPSVENHTGIVLDESDLEWFRDCYFDSKIHQRNPYADPINACDLSGVAPATVITAGFDPLRDGGKAYAERLVDDEVSVRHINYENMIHGFIMHRDIDRAREAIAAVGRDLADALLSS